MSSEFGIVKSVSSRWTALVLVAGFAACVDDTVTPAPEATPPAKPPRVLGFAELTFSGIGTPDLSSSLLVAPTLEALEELRAQRERSGDLRDFVAQDLTLPANSDGSGNSTIQLTLHQSNEFAFDGVRYLNATYGVRNAQLDSAAYDTERTNLTFLAVSTTNTVNQTAVRRLLLDGGTPAPQALALEVLPTDLLTTDGTTLTAAHPDVLQVLREAEVAGVPAPAGVTSVFPYGFVVRLVGSTTTRTLPASPPDGNFAGIVDFGFSIPQQPSPAEDPQTLSVLMLAVDDSETQITQGLQEQTPAASEALQQLAGTLGVDTVTILPGGSLPSWPDRRTLCIVRTAGTPGSPTAHLVNVDWSLVARSVSASVQTFSAEFSAPVEGAGPDNFTVIGSQTGKAFVGSAYSGNGTPTIVTPQGNFLPGEEVEVTLTNALSCPQPVVSRYLVPTTVQATGGFVTDSSYQAGAGPRDVAIGDVNGDGNLDLAAPDSSTNVVSVLINNGGGTGTFQSPQTYGVGTSPLGVVMGDLNGDGSPDLVVLNRGSNNVSVLINNGGGSGTFQAQQTYSAGAGPHYGAVGDLNGDGSLDIVAPDFGGTGVSVLLNNGDGTFPTQNNPTYVSGSAPTSVSIGDVNGDGNLDLAVANFGTDSVSVLLNDTSSIGTFQSPQRYVVGVAPARVALGDLNGDGSPDLATANQGSGNASVLLNDGTGNFLPQTIYTAGTSAHYVAMGDITANGWLDLVVANRLSNNVSVFVNNADGSGTFQAQQTYPAGTDPWVAEVGDLNGNGILDLAVANRGSNVVRVMLGQPQP